MSEPLETSSPSTSCAADSPVKTSRSPEKAPASTATDRGCGGNLRGSFAIYDPASSSWKTSSDSAPAVSATFSEAWSASGMTRSGIAYRRPGSEPRISAAVSSLLLPTPTAESYGTSQNGNPGDGRTEYRGRGKPSLWTMAKTGLLPDGMTGNLHPRLVEWMQGFSPGWTDLFDED